MENIVKQKLLTRSEVENLLNFQLGERNLIITFHPVTLENQTAENQFNEILKSILNWMISNLYLLNRTVIPMGDNQLYD